MKSFLSFILITFLAISSFAQVSDFVPQTRTCGTMEHHNHQLETNPEMEHQKAISQQQMLDWIAANPNFNDSRATYTMPIVFHVVYRTSAQNISDALIFAQLDQINDDFQAINSDINSVPSEFNVGNVDIEFCLATIDPNGNPTTGITRTQTNTNSFSTNDAVKYTSQGGLNAWNTNMYFNVWICNMGGGILGYGQFPDSFASQPNTDGLVLTYQSVGSLTQPNPQGGQFDRGRTATHELGHCLGLYHIWGDGNSDCNGTDYVNDTPNQAGASSGCPNYPTSSCSSNDMTMNYMDYSNDICLSAFTVGQANRIASAINTFQYLQNKIAAAGQVCGAAPLTAGISGSASGCAPFSTSFSDSSSGEPSSWSWSFPGGSPSSFNGQNPPTITYANPGNYTATLTVSNGGDSDSENIGVTVQDCSNINCNLIDNLNNGTIVLIENPDGNGYVAGHNSFGDIAKAEYFTNLGTANQLNGVEYDFGYATGSGSVEFVIWADNGGTPGTELATQSISLSTIIADVNANNNTVVDFGGIISIPSSFFAGFKLVYDNTHLVGLNTNSDGQTNPTTAYEQWSDNSWHSFDDGTTATWELAVSMAIYPNVCSPASTGVAPNANFTTNILSQGCETVQMQYIDNSTNDPTSWSWSFPGGNPSSSTMQNPTVVYTSAGSYNATLTATNATGNNSSTQNNVVVITPALDPMATLNPNTVDLATSSGEVTFTDNTAGATSWIWDFGDGSATANTQIATHTYSMIGTYIITLTLSDGICTDVVSAELEVTNTSGIEDIVGLSSMNIHPNPSSGTFFLTLNSNEVLDLQVEVFDAIGRKVIDAGRVQVIGTVVHAIEASRLTSGTYFVRITSGENTATIKVLRF